ncbi:hypothetical protein CPC08DRAFT_705100 [Agrocybe pediades]|nr:hypothetical protein CPC08DRAFT_705100 [Agrocybe pediades]
MSRNRPKLYNDGLTKQQRYVQRNKEKVYAANAARRRRERAAKRKSKVLTESPEDTPPKESSATPPVEDTKTPALTEEVDSLFLSWYADIDDAITRFDKCWNMKHGWRNKTPFASSKTEALLKAKIEGSRELLDRLQDLLQLLPPGSDDWNLALSRIQTTSFKTGQMVRINSYFTNH